MKWLNHTWNDIDDIHYGFAVIILAFLIPGIFLFYFMISFKIDGIKVGKREMIGTEKIDEAILNIQSHFRDITNFVPEHEHITQTVQEYSLQLDSNPESFYMSAITSYGVPSLLEAITPLQFISAQSPKREENLDKIADLKSRVDIWLTYARNQDGKINGYNSEFQSRFLEERENFYASLDSIINSNGKVTDKNIDDIFQFWNFSNRSMREMIQKRIAAQRGQLYAAMTLTVLVWLASVVFTLWFSRRVGQKRMLLQEKIRQQDITLMMTSKMTALGELAGNIAHEVNTPLGAIRLNAELIDQLVHENPVPVEKIANLSANLNRTVDKISQIITSMLKYARSDSKDTFKQVNLSSIFHEALLLCQENITKKSIELKMDVAQQLEIECRPNEILQVILNLIKNSIDAVESLPEKWIRVEASQDKDRVIFSVTDSGYTKSISDPVKIFTPFYSTKPTGQGTGLGLGISRRLIESHRGMLHLDPQSKHTRFVINLPASGSTTEIPSQLSL